MIVGVPNGGLDEVGRSAFVNHPPYTLVCYTNARNSLGVGTLVTNLVQPNVLNGYAPILLDGVWASLNGDETYTHRPGVPKPKWIATGAWSAAVTGVAMVYNAIVVAFSDIPGGVDFVAANGGFLEADLITVI